jgi:transposase-like protein
MSSPVAKSPYVEYRFPGEVISRAIWLYFHFPLNLRMVEEMLTARGIVVSHEAVRQWALKFGQSTRVRTTETRASYIGFRFFAARCQFSGPSGITAYLCL